MTVEPVISNALTPDEEEKAKMVVPQLLMAGSIASLIVTPARRFATLVFPNIVWLITF